MHTICGPFLSIRGVQWSPDEKLVVFSIRAVPGELWVYLLNLSSGAVQQFTQYPWSNVSVDGSLYALQVTNIQSKNPITNLVFGSLDGDPTTTFAFANVNAGTVEVAGWTLM